MDSPRPYILSNVTQSSSATTAWIMKLSIAFTFCIFAVQPLHAQSNELQATTAGTGLQTAPAGLNIKIKPNEDPVRFSIYKPSFVMWSVPAKNKDEAGIQVRLSAKYNLLSCTNATEQKNGFSEGTCNISRNLPDSVGMLNVFVSYTTDFDFYIRSDGDKELDRNSRPVRNRMTSPGFHFNWTAESKSEKSGLRYRSSMISLVHHSNGQDLEFETLFEPESTDDEIRDTIAQLASNNPSWMDGVSRGWNFIELATTFDIGGNVMECKSTFLCTQLSIGVKFPIFSDPNEIWWEPGNTARYRDFNIGSIHFFNEWGEPAISDPQFFSLGKKALSLEFNCGKKTCSTSAALRFDTNLGEGNFTLPMMVYGHFGRNEHIYNYHEKASMIGLGLRFTR